MNRVFPYLFVNNANNAIKLYKKAFDAILIGDVTYLESNGEANKKISHATLAIEKSQFFIGEADLIDYDKNSRITVNVELSSESKVKQAFEVLEKKAKKIYYKPQHLPWSSVGFSLRCQFEIDWMIYYRK
tara:strand:- start:3041 stop:3430 length:390 start_codon:yes stop_codon:yes gene_type:complete